MDTREKLIELLRDGVRCPGVVDSCVDCPHFSPGNTCDEFSATADMLIANGVTVQKEAKLYWKPVKPGEWNLTCSACDSHLGCRENASYCPECGAKFVYPKAVAPQPQKGD